MHRKEYDMNDNTNPNIKRDVKTTEWEDIPLSSLFIDTPPTLVDIELDDDLNVIVPPPDHDLLNDMLCEV